MLALFAWAASGQTRDYLVNPSTGFQIMADQMGVVKAAVSPSGKAVVIRADEEGHVICH